MQLFELFFDEEAYELILQQTLLYAHSKGEDQVVLTAAMIILGIVMPLSRVEVVFCFGNYFRYSPLYKPLLVHFILEAIFIDSYFWYSPVDKPFLVNFLSVFIGCFFG